MVYLVSYDLNADVGNYFAVHEAIRSLGDVQQCLESSWLVCSRLTAEQIFSRINQVLGLGDRCFICRIAMPCYSGVTYKKFKVWNWLKGKV